MARTISKAMTISTIHAFDPTRPFDTDEKGMPIANVTFTHNGNVNAERGQRLAELHCKSKNVMFMFVTTETTKSVVSPELFYVNSEPCENDKSYGHDTVVQEFTFTFGDGFYMTPDGMQKLDAIANPDLMYFGRTTMSKYINYLRETLKTNMVSVTCLKHGKSKRWMTKEKYAQIATQVTDEN